MTTHKPLTKSLHERPLPNGWRWVRLKEVTEVISGQHILESDYNVNGNGIGYLTGPADFGVLKPIIAKWTEKPRATCEPMDVLVTVKGAGVGKINLSPDIPVAIGRQLMAIRSHFESVDTMFLFSFLATCLGHFQGSAMGATVPGLSRADLETLAIPLPPITEQRRITTILKEQMAGVEKARTAAKARLEAVKALPAAFLRQVFPQPGQPLPEGWRWVKLGEVCLFRRGPFGGSLRKEIFVQSGYAVYEKRHAICNDFSKFRYYISEEKFDEMRGFKVCAGDLIMSCSGTMGKVAIIPENAPAGVINQALLKLTPTDHIFIVFLKAWMESANFQQSIADLTLGAAIKNVASVGILKAMPVPLPPLPEQQRIAGVLREQMVTAEKARAAAEAELTAVNALPAALLRRAFAGEL